MKLAIQSSRLAPWGDLPAFDASTVLLQRAASGHAHCRGSHFTG
jgi:hypothetical protein